MKFESSRGFFYLLVKLVVTVKGLVMPYIILNFLLLSNAYQFVVDSMSPISSFLIDIFCYSCTFNHSIFLLWFVIQVWGAIIMQKRYHGPDYLLAFLVTLGCSVFILYPVIIGSLMYSFFYCLITFFFMQLLSIEEQAMNNHMLPY